MCDGWDENPVIVQPPCPQFTTQVFTNRDRRQANWNDEPQRNFQPRNSSRRERDDNGSGGNRGGNRRIQNDDPSTLIMVPSKFVGRIIGRGGSKINDLQFESGAKINVTKDTDGDQTIIKIAGRDDAVAKAEELIRDLTIERNPYSAPERSTYSAPAGNTYTTSQWKTYSTLDSQKTDDISSQQDHPKHEVKSWRELLRESVSIFYNMLRPDQL